MLDFIDILEKWGPLGAMIAVTVVYIMRDWQRISKLEDRVQHLETKLHDSLEGMLNRCEQTLSFNNKVLEKLVRAD